MSSELHSAGPHAGGLRPQLVSSAERPHRFGFRRSQSVSLGPRFSPRVHRVLAHPRVRRAARRRGGRGLAPARSKPASGVRRRQPRVLLRRAQEPESAVAPRAFARSQRRGVQPCRAISLRHRLLRRHGGALGLPSAGAAAALAAEARGGDLLAGVEPGEREYSRLGGRGSESDGLGFEQDRRGRAGGAEGGGSGGAALCACGAYGEGERYFVESGRRGGGEE